MTEIRHVTRGEVRALGELDVREDQGGMVAPNYMTMAQSAFEPGSEIFGLWDGDRPVGLLAIVDMSDPDADLDEGDDPDGIYIWRLMVDGAHQGRGHGRAALDHARALARERGRAHMALSAVECPGCAIPFYETYGFRRSGRLVDGEVELTFRPV